jgi:FkbM family methyltransferase
VTDEVLLSYAQNCEDVVLWRALRHVPNGRYIDVGANDPTVFSITRTFYDHGWRGISVEPSHHFAQLHRDQRPGDIVVEAAATSQSETKAVLHEINDTGLSTLVDEVRERHASHGWEVHDVEVAATTLNAILEQSNWEGLDIHFMTVDVEGSEGDVLASIDLRHWRPWVLVIESTAPLSTEQTHTAWEPLLLKADYEFCLFDGLSRYYVASEHGDDLRTALSYSASVFDSFQSYSQRELMMRTEGLAGEVDGLRAREQAATAQRQLLELELEAIRHTISWRVTAPLRAVHRLIHGHSS